MSTDETQQQSPDELTRSRELSLEPARPPAEIPGYSLEQFLGSGAFGEVWLGTDRKTGRRVAVKFYTRRSSTDLEILAREVQKLVVLAADRYVVQLLDVGWEANPPYYVMDYIEHGSIEDRLRSERTLPSAEAIELFQEIVLGMMHMHGKGILHCDLKPGNVLLDQDGKPRLADFGQSRLSTDETPSLGTLFYMAPEQANLSSAPDACWDVYSIGALLFRMLTGRPPYYDEQLTNKIETTPDFAKRLDVYRRGLLRAPKPTAHRQIPGVDRLLADIIDRCIAADPRQRFSSMQSVMLALRQREMTRARRPLMVLGLIGPLLLIGVMSLFAWRAYQQSVGDFNVAIVDKAKESNRFAAKLAARSASEQIDAYFRAVSQLARDEAFRMSFEKVLADDALTDMRSQLSNPNDNDATDLDVLREEFIVNETRLALQEHLAVRIDDPFDEYPASASWLAYDRQGNQLASVFLNPPEKNTIGKNYSYRTYFTGLDHDLVTKDGIGNEIYTVPQQGEQREIIAGPHLSAVFKSKAAFTWKVAFSAPIEIDGEVMGIVAVTVEMGNFIQFEDGRFQYAMLVDGRPGAESAVILEHPLFDKLVLESKDVPKTTVDLSSISPDRTIFRDPIGKQVGGEQFDRDAIAAVTPVVIAGHDNTVANEPASDQQESGLLVLAVEDFRSVLAPGDQLGRRLAWLGLYAALFLLGVAVGMWLLVLRMLRESRLRLSRSFSPSAEPNSVAEMSSVGKTDTGKSPESKSKNQ